MGLGLFGMWGATLFAQEAPLATYGDEVAFLKKHTEVLEIVDRDTRIAICPAYQGRVMTSTFGGMNGPSLGWINHAFIEAAKQDDHFNNFGGEDRFWLAPEAGQYGLFFKPGADLTFGNWYTPPELNTGAFQAVPDANVRQYHLTRTIKLSNVAGTEFQVAISRNVRLHDRFSILLQGVFPKLQEANFAKTKFVGFSTTNEITNRGSAQAKDKGLLSVWTLGMFPPGERTAIIVPYRSGEEAESTPVVNHEGYFGKIPDDRLKILPQAILFRGDGKHRCKLGTSPQRVMPVAGSIDFTRKILTLVEFSLPDEPAKEMYVNNYWKLPQDQPYQGDVFNSYNDGPPEPGVPALGGFYELETLSPARELKQGETIRHVHRTFHFHGELADLDAISQTVLGVSFDEVRKGMGW